MSTDKYQIWIEADGQKLCLPVNPPKIDVKISGNNKSMTLAELGEAVIPQSPKAMTLSFSSFLPARHLPYSRYIDENDVSDNVTKIMPHYYINFITSAMKEKRPVRVYITGCDIIRFMTVENFSYSQKGGDVGSYDYSLSFKEYREVTVRKITVRNGKAVVPKKTEKRVSTMARPKTYVVKKGDTIYSIAKKYYGDVFDYRKIYNANKAKIGSNPNNIKVGMVLSLP